MSHIKSFGIIGGDKRQLYCAKAIASDGYAVKICGFDDAAETFGLEHDDIAETFRSSDALILPLPCSRDGKHINAPFSQKDIIIDESISSLIADKPVFCGMKNKLPFSCGAVYDYAEREEFAVENAVPTSEGAVEIAMHEYEGTINSSSCLVTGYGRIGRVLSEMLGGIGADVTVSARNHRDIAFIRSRGFRAINSENITGSYDIIFNTVPHMLFDSCTLARTASKALVIDLASAPGGVDFEAAKRLSIKAIHALSLPGKVAPKASGMIIKNAVYNIIREEHL